MRYFRFAAFGQFKRQHYTTVLLPSLLCNVTPVKVSNSSDLNAKMCSVVPVTTLWCRSLPIAFWLNSLRARSELRWRHLNFKMPLSCDLAPQWNTWTWKRLNLVFFALFSIGKQQNGVAADLHYMFPPAVILKLLHCEDRISQRNMKSKNYNPVNDNSSSAYSAILTFKRNYHGES